MDECKPLPATRRGWRGRDLLRAAPERREKRLRLPRHSPSTRRRRRRHMLVPWLERRPLTLGPGRKPVQNIRRAAFRSINESW